MGLKRVAAVAYTDKALAMAPTISPRTRCSIFWPPNHSASAGAQFVATLPAGTAASNRMRSNTPIRQQNREGLGKFTLQAVKFALFR